MTDNCRVCGTDLGAGYLCDDCDTVEIDRRKTTKAIDDEVTFFFGAASGSARKALRELQEPNVMLNYASKMNTPWHRIDRLFVDCGGYSFMKGKGEYSTSDAEYLDFIEEHKPELFALRDYPCEPDVLDQQGTTVEGHQRMTTERHVSLMGMYEDRGLSASPVSVIQGWAMDDYLAHLDTLRDRGVLTDYVGVGSVCRRNREDEIRNILVRLRSELPDRVDMHAFGVKGSVLQFTEVQNALTSSDSQSYDMNARWSSVVDRGAGNHSWTDVAQAYLEQRNQIRTLLTSDEKSDGTQESVLAY